MNTLDGQHRSEDNGVADVLVGKPDVRFTYHNYSTYRSLITRNHVKCGTVAHFYTRGGSNV